MKRRIALSLILLSLAASCVHSKQNAESMPALTPPPTEEAAPSAQANPGSLYSPGNAEYLFSDNRARRVGDIVMVNIVENSSGKNTADTQSDKDSSMSLTVPDYFGKSVVGVGMLAGINPLKQTGTTGATPLVSTANTSKFKATGSTDRSTKVTATLGCRVVKLLPGGLMQIEGARQVRVNDETQIMVVRGLVRPRDIGSTNSVDSTHLSDAKIEYYGKGVLADRQKQGWLTRLLDNVWPF